MSDHRMSGPLSEIARIARQDIQSVEPPMLDQYRDAPIYDHTVILQLVNVRPIALWALEQHIGISTGARGAPDPSASGQKRRYSERDLVALLWLRQRVVEGEPPQEAGGRLIAAQRQRNSGALGPSGPLRPPADAGGQNTPYPGFTPHGVFAPTTSGSLGFSEYPSGSFQPTPNSVGGLGSAGSLGAPGVSSYQGPTAYQGAPSYGQEPQRADYSGGWSGASQYGAPRMPRATHPIADRVAQATPRPAGASGRLGSIYGAPTPITRPPSAFDPARDQAMARELRWLVSPLMQAFSRFDTAGANRLVQQALEQFSVEVVCLGLVQHAIARVSDLWSRNELTIPEERFAYSFLRGFLTSVFHSTMEPEDAPLVVVGCAQRDANDLPALLLAVFWRRSGLRVLYLGADAGSDDLARQRWAEVPALIGLTLSSTQRIRSVNHLAKQLRALPQPRPTLCYTGSVFLRNADLQRKVNAEYLGDEPAGATTTARRLLGMIF